MIPGERGATRVRFLRRNRDPRPSVPGRRDGLPVPRRALAILWTITRHLGWQTYECTATASRLCEITWTKKQHMAVALKLLEEVGSIRRVRRDKDNLRWQIGLWIAAVVVVGVLIRWPARPLQEKPS